ncbi:hypothetical protein LCGC14_0773660 [marine sediment metagenome]|uniref:DUF4055 domain-containing protein n=1 Tax=marine sediment metagenome TaxID=412755 RepID=A0A0F9Q1P6_9ZZZZ
MAIDRNHITDEYKTRSIVRSKIELWRRAADGDFDEGKFEFFGKSTEELKKDTAGKKHDPFLIRFERETNWSYITRMELMNNPGITEMIVASYTDTFNKVSKNVEMTGFDDSVKDRIENNFDGEGHTLEQFINQAFSEMVKTDIIYGATDTVDATPAGSENPVFMPIGYLVPREDVRNFHSGHGAFDFVTWDTIKSEAVGISVKNKPAIIIFTSAEIATAEQEKGGWRVVKTAPHDFGFAPVRTANLNEGRSIIHSVAGIEFNLFNLDSEERRHLRNQAGMNFLGLPKSFWEQYKDKDGRLAFDDQSIITFEPGDDGKWIAWPANSLEAYTSYAERKLKLAMMVSRQRQTKLGAETDKAKLLDFSQPDAVLNIAANELETFAERMISDMGTRADRKIEVTVTIDREFNPSQIKEALENLELALAVGFGKTFDDFKKLEFVKKHRIDASQLAKIKKEIEQEKTGVPETFSTAELIGAENNE